MKVGFVPLSQAQCVDEKIPRSSGILGYIRVSGGADDRKPNNLSVKTGSGPGEKSGLVVQK